MTNVQENNDWKQSPSAGSQHVPFASPSPSKETLSPSFCVQHLRLRLHETWGQCLTLFYSSSLTLPWCLQVPRLSSRFHRTLKMKGGRLLRALPSSSTSQRWPWQKKWEWLLTHSKSRDWLVIDVRMLSEAMSTLLEIGRLAKELLKEGNCPGENFR